MIRFIRAMPGRMRVALMLLAMIVTALWFAGRAWELFGLWNWHAIVGYDKILHVLAGGWWGLLGIACYAALRKGLFDPGRIHYPEEIAEANLKLLIWAFAFMLPVGILWEIWEWTFGICGIGGCGVTDTVFDLIWDSAGAWLAYQQFSLGPRNVFGRWN